MVEWGIEHRKNVLDSENQLKIQNKDITTGEWILVKNLHKSLVYDCFLCH